MVAPNQGSLVGTRPLDQLVWARRAGTRSISMACTSCTSPIEPAVVYTPTTPSSAAGAKIDIDDQSYRPGKLNALFSAAVHHYGSVVRSCRCQWSGSSWV